MSPNEDARPLVLIVEDEVDVADAHALKLQGSYRTRVAYGGEEGLGKMDEDVDAVLLDRRMPDLHGDDVLREIRERGYDCPVIMTTAVDPDLNILEMDFDDYLCKPILSDTLEETLEKHVTTAEQGTDERLEEFFEVVSKIDVLESEKSSAELEGNEQYQQLKQRANELGTELDESMSNFDELVDTYRDINRSST